MADGCIHSITVCPASKNRSGGGAAREMFFITTDHGVAKWTISREMRFQEYKGHADAVVCIVTTEQAGSAIVDVAEKEGKGKGKGKGEDAAVLARASRGQEGGRGAGRGMGRGILGGPGAGEEEERALTFGGKEEDHGEEEEGDQEEQEEDEDNDDEDLALLQRHSHRIFSASLDNTICSWDPYGMTCVFTLTERQSELSCMLHLGASDLLVTGHDDGCLKWWNPSSGSMIRLEYVRREKRRREKEGPRLTRCVACRRVPCTVNRTVYRVSYSY